MSARRLFPFGRSGPSTRGRGRAALLLTMTALMAAPLGWGMDNGQDVPPSPEAPQAPASDPAPAADSASAPTVEAPGVTAVPTFSCIGLTWSGAAAPADPNADTGCRLEYRAAGAEAWRSGLPLWYDVRNREYRGSLVNLQAGTAYEIRLTLEDGTAKTIQSTTWSEHPVIAKTVELPESSDAPLLISESGTADGYILYAPAPGKTATIDVAKRHDFDVVVTGSHVIVRGLTLRGARHSAILLGPTAEKNSADVSDVIIDGNDISGWGSNAANDPALVAKTGNAKVYGVNMQAAVYARSSALTRVVIQRNRMHHPSTTSNSWKEPNCSHGGSFHPAGPQGISIFDSKGNLVVRYNEIWSDDEHYFNDSMGEWNNFSDGGFPNRDSDIHGNLIRNCWDDGIESEGANKNVRIWGNYIDKTYIKIAIATVHRGPIYIWRNVAASSRTSADQSHGQGFLKTRNSNGDKDWGGGRVYLFNNSAIVPPTGSGVSGFISEFNEENRLVSFRTLNNFIQLKDPERLAIKEVFGTTSRFDYDFLVGKTRFHDPAIQERHGITGVPLMTPGWGFDEATHTGVFSLADGSPGHRQGVVIPNFAEAPAGSTAPDVGADESGSGPMQFGTQAYLH